MVEALRARLRMLDPVVIPIRGRFYKVYTFTGRGPYYVDLDARACTCEGFYWRKGCSHVPLVERFERSIGCAPSAVVVGVA